jgi:type III secretion protein C
LKVTPSVEPTGEARRNIRLNIQIDDGSFNTTKSVDGIPQVDNHSVVTQAIVRDGESLLIGGYQYERNESTASKVPVLGDVPYLGALFRSTQTNVERFERLVLITPRIRSLAGDGKSEVTLPAAGNTLGVSIVDPYLPTALAPMDAGAPRSPQTPSGDVKEPVRAAATSALDLNAALRANTQRGVQGSPQPSGLSPVSELISPDGLVPTGELPWEKRHDR